jgi:riboflavin kinase/FMN adenylyltransferase
MRLFTRIEEVQPKHFRHPVATVGVFDGVHLGHQAILHDIRRLAREAEGEGVVLTFQPHPEAVLRGAPPPSIHSLPHRLLLLQRAGAENVVVIDFNEAMSKVPAEDFLRRLVDQMGMVGFVMGPDNRFGQGGEGNIEFARKMGQDLKFRVHATPPVQVSGQRVSSTAIRAAIRDGELDLAAAMMSRPVTFLGEVVKGDGRGSRIGFPTANLALPDELHPPNGVYLATTTLQRKIFRSLVNIGVRPTFEGTKRMVEVHLLNFTGHLYGLSLEVIIHRRLRDEKKFRKVEDLVSQLQKDREAALVGLGGLVGK